MNEQLIQRITQLITWANNVVSNSKRIDELPEATAGVKYVAVWNQTAVKTQKQLRDDFVNQNNTGSYMQNLQTKVGPFNAQSVINEINSGTGNFFIKPVFPQGTGFNNPNAVFVTSPFTVTETDAPVFFEYTVNNNNIIEKHIYIFLGGKGKYGVGATLVNANHIKLFSIQQQTIDDIENNPLTNINYLGDIPGGNYLPVINSTQYDFSLAENQDGQPITYYFSYTDDDVLYFLLYTGPNGIFGGPNNPPFQDQDLVASSNSNIQPTLVTPSLQQVTAVNNIVNFLTHIFKSGTQKLTIGSYGMDYSNGGPSTSVGFRNPVTSSKIFIPQGRDGDDILTTRDLLTAGTLNHGQIRKTGKGYKQDGEGNFINNTGPITLHEPGDSFEAWIDGYRYPLLRYNGPETTNLPQNLQQMIYEFRYKATLPGEPGYEAPE